MNDIELKLTVWSIKICYNKPPPFTFINVIKIK